MTQEVATKAASSLLSVLRRESARDVNSSTPSKERDAAPRMVHFTGIDEKDLLIEQAKKTKELSLPILIAAASEGDWSLRASVLDCLSRIDSADERVHQFACQSLLDASVDVRTAAVAAIVDSKKDSSSTLDALRDRVLRDTSLRVRYSAAEALGRFGVGIPLLCEMLNSSDPLTIRCAAAALVNKTYASDCIVPALSKVVTRVDQETARHVACALGSFGMDAAAAEGPLISALERHANNAQVVFAISYAIACLMDKHYNEHVIKSVELLKSSLVREKASFVMAVCGPVGKQVVPILVEATNYDDISETAIDLLGRVGPGGDLAVSAVSRALKRGDIPIRRAAVTALGRMASDSGVAVSLLFDALRDPDYRVRVRAEVAISKLPNVGAVNVGLRGMLQGADPDLKSRIIDCFTEVAEIDDGSIEALKKVFRDSSETSTLRLQALDLLVLRKAIRASDVEAAMGENGGSVEYLEGCRSALKSLKKDP